MESAGETLEMHCMHLSVKRHEKLVLGHFESSLATHEFIDKDFAVHYVIPIRQALATERVGSSTYKAKVFTCEVDIGKLYEQVLRYV